MPGRCRWRCLRQQIRKHTAGPVAVRHTILEAEMEWRITIKWLAIYWMTLKTASSLVVMRYSDVWSMNGCFIFSVRKAKSEIVNQSIGQYRHFSGMFCPLAHIGLVFSFKSIVYKSRILLWWLSSAVAVVKRMRQWVVVGWSLLDGTCKSQLISRVRDSCGEMRRTQFKWYESLSWVIQCVLAHGDYHHQSCPHGISTNNV